MKAIYAYIKTFDSALRYRVKVAQPPQTLTCTPQKLTTAAVSLHTGEGYAMHGIRIIIYFCNITAFNQVSQRE
jgi:hypothetical protein